MEVEYDPFREPEENRSSNFTYDYNPFEERG
jgi:hypothetical protein